MMIKTTRTLTVAAGLAVAMASFADTAAGIPQIPEQTRRNLASAMLPMMPPEHRAAIIAAGGIGSEEYLVRVAPNEDGEILVANDERFEKLRGIVSPALFARLSEDHLKSLIYLRERAATDALPVAQCFAPGTDPELVAAYELLFREQFWGGDQQNGERFELAGRWTSTATDGFLFGGRGTPITLTYSFAPDGAVADNLFGQNRVNRLFDWMNSIYGTPATWQPLFDSVFEDWGNLIGVSYVYEPNDDGVEANTLAGELGVRGDVRIFAVNLDGNFNVLAYNQFPNAGDMVFDAFDSFYNSTTQFSRRLRNVASHEHGHGLGIAHVCPQDGTKLMEPSANINFDGPQFDDILAGQRNYGDIFEPNDSVLEFHDLGSVSVGTTSSIVNATLDDGTDVDYYRVTTTQPLELDVTLAPDGITYREGPQNANGSCSSGTLNNFNQNLDLSLEIVNSSGSRIEFANNTGLGGSETLATALLTPGTYFVVVDHADALNNIQRYRLDVVGASVPFEGPSIDPVGTLPEAVQPNQSVDVDFTIVANADTIIDGPDLLYRFDAGAYTRVTMNSVGGNVFRGTIPAAECGDLPQYYIEVEGDVVGPVRLPEAGAAAPFTYIVGEIGTILDEDFETPDAGWDDSIATASQGLWTVGTPVASTGAPSTDFDGSGQCYLTGNGVGEDVDGGRTILRTPAFDLSSGGTLTYAYWFGSGGTPVFDDFLAVEVSFDQQVTWTRLRTYDAESAGWETDTIEIDGVDGVSETYFRFIAEDGGFNTTCEAAIDAVTVTGVTCGSEPTGCNAADIAAPLGVLDLGDINAFIAGFTSQDPIADLAAPFGVWDLADIGTFTAAFVAGCP